MRGTLGCDRPSGWLAVAAVGALGLFAYFAGDLLVSPLCGALILLSYTHRWSVEDRDTRTGLFATLVVALLVVGYYVVFIAARVGSNSAHRAVVSGEHLLALAGLAAAVALARLWHVRSARTRKSGLALALIGLLAVVSGNAYDWNRGYLIGLALFMIATLAALLHAGGALALRGVPARARAVRLGSAVMCVVVILPIAVGSALVLRKAERVLVGWRPGELSRRPMIGSAMRVRRDMRLSLSSQMFATLDGASAPGYLRMEVFSRYDAGLWTSDDPSRPLDAPSGEPVRLSPSARQPRSAASGERVVEVHDGLTGSLMLPYGARQLQLPHMATECTLSSSDLVRCPTPIETYAVTVEADAVVAASEPTNAATDLADDVALKLRPLALSIVGSSSSDREAAERIATHLRTHHRYSLRVKLARGVDPLVDFVLQRRAGWCEHFAAAMALMMRSVDIPARVVGGFYSDEHNPIADRWIVRLDDAHAWVEIYDREEQAWIAFDPTPTIVVAASGRDALRALVRSISDGVWLSWRQFVAAWARLDLAQSVAEVGAAFAAMREPVLAMLTVVVLLARRRIGRIASVVARGLRRLLRGRERELMHPATHCFRRLETALVAAGVPIRSDETLAAYQRRLTDECADVAVSIQDFAVRYLALRFAPASVALGVGEELQRLERCTTETTELVRGRRRHESGAG